MVSDIGALRRGVSATLIKRGSLGARVGRKSGAQEWSARVERRPRPARISPYRYLPSAAARRGHRLRRTGS